MVRNSTADALHALLAEVEGNAMVSSTHARLRDLERTAEAAASAPQSAKQVGCRSLLLRRGDVSSPAFRAR